MEQSHLKHLATEVASKISISEEDESYFRNPFQHIVIDNFFPNEFALKLSHAFDKIEKEEWEYTSDEGIEVKYRTNWKSEFDIPDSLAPAIRILNSAPILSAMSDRLGIPKLMPDPYFTGGGINATKSGGLLDVHVDGNYHDATSLNRRMNALIYLNPNWEKEWGGEFGIYDEFGENCVKSIAPLFNRLVVFDSHDKSWHGLPEPINFPSDQVRRSIILYYYTAAPRPGNQVTFDKPHSALWKKRNKKDKKGNLLREFY